MSKTERAHDSGTPRLSGKSRRSRQDRPTRSRRPDFGASVQKRADKVKEDYHKAAKKLDAKLDTPAGATGPVEAETST